MKPINKNLLLSAIVASYLILTSQLTADPYTIQGFGLVQSSPANGSSEWLDSYEFRVGGLSGAFNPANITSLPSLWKDLSAGLGGSYVSATNEFSAVGTENDNSVFSVDEQLYIWGYNTRSTGSGTEWLLITSTEWTMGSNSIAGSGENYDTINQSFNVVLGSFAPGSGNFDGTFTSVQAIPEPSTYAAMMAAGVLGFVFVRRIRKQKRAFIEA